jgi:hypothetical protein
MMQSHGVKIESAKRSYLHLCCRQFGSVSKITILDACEYNNRISVEAHAIHCGCKILSSGSVSNCIQSILEASQRCSAD